MFSDRATASGRRPVVTREHDDAEAVVVQLLDGFGRRLLEGISHAQQAHRIAVDSHEHDGLALTSPRFGARGDRVGIDAEIVEQAPVAEHHALVIHLPRDTLAGHGGEALRVH